jgi:hypothetical protein
MDVDVIENILNIPSTPEVIVAYARIDAPVDAKVHIQPGALQIIKDSDHSNSTDYLQVVRKFVTMLERHDQRYNVHIISNPYINKNFREDFRILALDESMRIGIAVGPWFVKILPEYTATSDQSLATLTVCRECLTKVVDRFCPDIQKQIRRLLAASNIIPGVLIADNITTYIIKLYHYVAECITFANLIHIPNKINVFLYYCELEKFLREAMEKLRPLHSKMITNMISEAFGDV